MKYILHKNIYIYVRIAHAIPGGGPRVVVSTASFHARVWGSFPGLGGLKKNKKVSSPSTRGEPP